MVDAGVMTGTAVAADDAFERIVAERRMAVLRTAYRILGNWSDAEDIAQEALVRLHRHGLNFPGDHALAGWLYRVTVNLALDRTRSARRWDELREAESGEASLESAAIQTERRKRLARALAQLPPRERAAVVLREIEGLSTEETAAVLGSAETTVRSQVSKGVARLRAILLEEEE